MDTPPPGVYRISRYGVFEEPQILTLLEGSVTVAAPDTVSPGSQEVLHFTFWQTYASLTNLFQQWRLEVIEQKKFAIQHPVNIFPSRSVSYKGEAEEGKRVELGPVSDFPTREWYLEPAPQHLPGRVYLSV